MRVTYWIIILLGLTGSLTSFRSNIEDQEIDLSQFFNDYKVTGSFILFDENKNLFSRYNPRRCNERFTPASTFKIPNSIIALEEHIVENSNSILKWDGIETKNPAWNKDLTLKEAFRASCVPCYVRIARVVGETKYMSYLEKLDYGNKSTKVENDDPNLRIAFWLVGELRISQEEQIVFLRKLYDYKLPASKHAIEVVKDILVDEKTDGYVLSGKLGRVTDSVTKKEIGWYVGYVEKNGNVYFFATNIESIDPTDDFGSARKDITLKSLRKLKVID